MITTAVLVLSIISSFFCLGWFISDLIRYAKEIKLENRYQKYIWLYIASFWWGLFYYLS